MIWDMWLKEFYVTKSGYIKTESRLLPGMKIMNLAYRL